jgi:hypothetical protein
LALCDVRGLERICQPISDLESWTVIFWFWTCENKCGYWTAKGFLSIQLSSQKAVFLPFLILTIVIALYSSMRGITCLQARVVFLTLSPNLFPFVYTVFLIQLAAR